MSLEIRTATSLDAELLHRFIVELAVYEREKAEVVENSVESLRAQLSADPAPFSCRLAFWKGEPAGIALYFFNYSSWRGRPGLYLEDLFVSPSLRGKGIGNALLRDLASIAVSQGCVRMEWVVLDWNQSAIEFYEKLGAKSIGEWSVFRLADQSLKDAAKSL